MPDNDIEKLNDSNDESDSPGATSNEKDVDRDENDVSEEYQATSEDVEAATEEKAPIKSHPSHVRADDDALIKSLANAQRLIRFASENGMAIPEELIKTIIDSADKLGTDQWSADQECAFWNSVCELSQKVSPVTIESINATLEPTRSKSKAGKETSLFSWITIAILVILIVCQIYWVIGNNVTSAIYKLLEKQQQIYTDIYIMENKLLSIDSDLKKISENNISLDNPEKQVALFYDNKAARIKPLNSQREDLLRKIEGKKLEKARKKNFLDANSSILESWIDWVLFDNSDTLMRKKPENADNFQTEYQLTLASSIIQAMSSYFLPMLYGLLGACAYILRTLFKDIRHITFHGASGISYRLRMPLGMLSGVAVGWFFKAEALSFGIASIQPLAIAFLAGYSVELLFTAMDKLIGAFVGDERKSKIAGGG